MSVNWVLPFDVKLIPEGVSRLVEPEEYARMHAGTVEKYQEYWSSIAAELEWSKPWKRILDDDNPPFYKWFTGGEINACTLCVDRHASGWRRNKVAILWESEAFEGGRPREVRKITYGELYREVNRAAWLLKNRYHVKKGDVIALYMPMVPELPVFMLAAAKLGVVFSVVFSGFSSDALAERLNDSQAKLIVTSDGGWRAGKEVPLKRIVDQALKDAPAVQAVVVLRRTGSNVEMRSGRDEYLDYAMSQAPLNVRVDPEVTKSEDPLYVLYTSGTTGKPKGQVHDTGGYMTLLHATMKQVFDIRDEDVYWCTADIGWVTGHSYIVFGPLMEGATTVMYEGSPTYPEPDRWASIVERHAVNVLYTSPTAIRSWMSFGDELVKKHDFSSVRLMHSVGEPLNPEAFNWFFKLVGRGRVPFGSTWWMTETGGVLISVCPGWNMVPMKPGSNGPPIPGVDADVLREDGGPCRQGERGLLVLKKPWPGMPLTIHRDPARYVEVYWNRFRGVYYAGDYAVKDSDGYFWVLGRADEVIKVAGHRLGTYELESALIQHPAVAEAAVVGVPDAVKGEIPVGFVILRQGYKGSDQLRRELNEQVRGKVGPIASLKSVYFVYKLPKTRSAKIMRRVIQAVVTGKPVGDVTTLEDGASIDEVKKAYQELSAELEH
ncbi:MAG: acetate--CoA ligase [Thermoprotei archaeon]